MNAPIQGVHTNYPEELYYADPCVVPSLTQSIAKTIIYQSEKHAWMQHPRLGGHPEEPTKAMNIGTICHALMLGKPLPEIELIPFDDYRKNEAKALRDAAKAAGKIPLKNGEASEWLALTGAAEALRDKIHARGIVFKPEESEVSLFWEKDGVQCRSRLDNLQGSHVLDLKFVACASPDAIDRAVSQNGYQIQDAAYCEAVRECCCEFRGRERFTFVFCEIEEPFCVTLAELSGPKKALGKAQWERARRQWSECLRTGLWNEYVTASQCHIVEAKPWELEREFGYGNEDI